MTNLLPYIESGFKIFFNRRHLRKIAVLRLKNEINYNLRIIDMINWNEINKETKRYFANQLSTIALEEYIYLGKPNIVEKLIDAKPNLKIEKTTDEKSIDKESLIGNIINRIKTIQIIANFPEELKENDKSRFGTRVNNIHIGLNDIKKLI
jgi:hypothetical protein